MQRLLALFRSTRDAIRAERLCSERQVRCKVIPVPREISAESGMALAFGVDQRQDVVRLFDDAGIDVTLHEQG